MEAKALCIHEKIGLFSLKEFMGAIRKTGHDFLNYLLNEERRGRIEKFSSDLKKINFARKFNIFLFGSFLRYKIFRDIDVILVYKEGCPTHNIDTAINEIRDKCESYGVNFDFIVCSEREFANMTLENDNRIQVL